MLLCIRHVTELYKCRRDPGSVASVSLKSEQHECGVNCVQVVMELSKGQIPIVGLM